MVAVILDADAVYFYREWSVSVVLAPCPLTDGATYLSLADTDG